MEPDWLTDFSSYHNWQNEVMKNVLLSKSRKSDEIANSKDLHEALKSPGNVRLRLKTGEHNKHPESRHLQIGEYQPFSAKYCF